MKEGHIRGADLLRTGTFIARHLFDTTGIIIRSRRPYLKDKSAVHMEALSSICFKEKIMPLLSKEALKQIAVHQDAGHDIVLLSGTLEMLARVLSRHVKADHYYACRPEERDGYFTGRIVPPIPYGEGKRQILISHATEFGVDLIQCYAYGDSMADVDVFESVGNPCVVNPGWRLNSVAKKKGWEIRYW